MQYVTLEYQQLNIYHNPLNDETKSKMARRIATAVHTLLLL